MTKSAAKKIRTSPGEAASRPAEVNETLDRSEQLMDKKNVREALLDIFKDVLKGFDKQAERSDNLIDLWDVYNCKLGPKQFYNGNSQIFVPAVYEAVEARVTRHVNQLFPKNGRYVEAVTEDGNVPYEETALLEHYVRKANLRTQVAPALARNGDVEGQYTVQVVWEEFTRHVAHRVKLPVQVDGDPMAGEEMEDIREEEITDGHPVVYVIADADLLVLPQTAISLAQALRDGGSVTTICRWSPAKIRRMIAEGEIDKEAGEDLLEEMKEDEKTQQRPDKPKEMVDAAGIKGDARGKFCLLYRTWTYLTIDDERRLCLCYYAGNDKILSCKRNPYWSDRIDIISCASDKVDGSFKGKPKLEFGVADMQYQANDACNQGMDSATYALNPICMTDPEKNPKIGQMVLAPGAVWPTSPSDTQFASFPPLWKDGLTITAEAKQEIFQALSVNASMVTSHTNKNQKRPNQAEISNEQQIDILTTNNEVTILENEIFTPILRFMLELDHQYRDRAIKVREYGELGMKQGMQEIPPIQLDKMYSFIWFGVEQARNAQQLQQIIAGINVLKGIPPDKYQGYQMELGPLLAHTVENLVGPRLAPLTFRPIQEALSIDPKMENELMLQGFTVPIHIQDDFQQHMQVHQQALQQDASGRIKVHMMAHLNAMQQRQAQQQQAAMPQPPGGGQRRGGGGGSPGGGPRIGAQPAMPRGGQGPAGMIHQDRMADPTRMPR